MSKVEKRDEPRLLKLAKVAHFTEISLIIYVCIGALQVVAQIASFFIGAPVGEPKNWDIPHLTTIFLLMGLALLSFIVFLVSAAGFLQWMFRAYRNLKKIEAPGVKHGEEWSVFYWFVPFVNLVKPFELVKEMWVATSKPGTTDKVPGIMRLWWAAWLLKGFFGYVAVQLVNGPQGFEIGTAIDLSGTIFGMGAALLLRQIVKSITAREEELIPEITSS